MGMVGAEDTEATEGPMNTGASEEEDAEGGDDALWIDDADCVGERQEERGELISGMSSSALRLVMLRVMQR